MNIFGAVSVLCGLVLGSFSTWAEELRLGREVTGSVFSASGTFSNGVVTLESASNIAGPWHAVQSVFTTGRAAQIPVAPAAGTRFYRGFGADLSGGRVGFTNLVRSFGLLTTVAGAGGDTAAVNKWLPQFEGGPATGALLSRPHIAMADRAGNVYIADKDAHAVRKVSTDGRITTVAGVNRSGNGPDGLMLGRNVELSEPNGLWVEPDGTVYILDLGNGKIRRLRADGMMSTLFQVPGGISNGRGLWVKSDETLAYVASSTVVKRWTPAGGVVNFSTGYSELGNLVVDPNGKLVVTDRAGHRVYRVEADGGKTVIAGTGATSGGGNGQLATLTGLNEVRGVWFLPTGAYFLATHRGSQLWYVDTDGYIHLFLNGSTADTHWGDGTWFYAPNEFRLAELRAVTMDHDGNLLITEHDSGYIRRVEFLRVESLPD